MQICTSLVSAEPDSHTICQTCLRITFKCFPCLMHVCRVSRIPQPQGHVPGSKSTRFLNSIFCTRMFWPICVFQGGNFSMCFRNFRTLHFDIFFAGFVEWYGRPPNPLFVGVCSILHPGEKTKNSEKKKSHQSHNRTFK